MSQDTWVHGTNDWVPTTDPHLLRLMGKTLEEIHELGIELHFWNDPTADRWTNDVACFVRFAAPQDAVDQHARWAGVEVPAPPSSVPAIFSSVAVVVTDSASTSPSC